MDVAGMIAGLQTERNRVDAAIAAIQILNEDETPKVEKRKYVRRAATATENGRGHRRPMSAAMRRRMGEIMKQRWAERRRKGKNSL